MHEPVCTFWQRCLLRSDLGFCHAHKPMMEPVVTGQRSAKGWPRRMLKRRLGEGRARDQGMDDSALFEYCPAVICLQMPSFHLHPPCHYHVHNRSSTDIFDSDDKTEMLLHSTPLQVCIDHADSVLALADAPLLAPMLTLDVQTSPTQDNLGGLDASPLARGDDLSLSGSDNRYGRRCKKSDCQNLWRFVSRAMRCLRVCWSLMFPFPDMR